MINYHAIDFDGLDKVLEAGLSAESIEMETWFRHNSCGTAACLIGTFCIQYPEDVLRLLKTDAVEDTTWQDPYIAVGGLLIWRDRAISQRFSLPQYLTAFLFLNHTYTMFGTASSEGATKLSGPEAVRRLRSTIKYLKRKRALLDEHEWWMSLSRKSRRESPQHFGSYYANVGVAVTAKEA